MGSSTSKLVSAVEKGDLIGVKEALKAEDADCNNQGDYTPLHKTCQTGFHKIAVALIDAGANVNAKDKREDTLNYEPLHFAAENGFLDIALLLLCSGASHSAKTAAGYHPLHLAINGNHHSIVANLISYGADLSTPDGSGKLPLHNAVERGLSQIVKSLIDANVDLSATDMNGNPALHLAIQNNHINVVSALIDSNADISAKNSSGETALHIGVKNGNLHIVQALVNASADTSARNVYGDLAHHIAASNGHTKVIEILLTAGIDTADFNSAGDQALHIAAQNGHHLIVAALLSSGADLSTPNMQGYSAAHIAALHGYTEVLKSLKKHGDDFKTLSNNESKDTPLHLATRHGHMGSVQWLVRNGAGIDIKNNNGITPIEIAKSHRHEVISTWYDRVLEQRRNVVQYARNGDFNGVLSAIDVGAKANNEILYRAVLAGKTRVVQAAISHGSNIEQSSFFYRYTLLHHASENGHNQVVQELLNAGANHSAVDYKGRTAMHLAARAGHKQVLEVMKTFGCDIQALSNNCYKWTPLHYAAWDGQVSAVKCLVQNGANKEAKDYRGNTPAKLAANRGFKDIAWWFIFGSESPENENGEQTSLFGDETPLNDLNENEKNKSNATCHNQERGDTEIPEICYLSVEGRCTNEQKCCPRLHCDRHYHWQVKEPFGSWLNLPEKQVTCLELAYCNPNLERVQFPPIDCNGGEFYPASLVDIMNIDDTWQANFSDMSLMDSGNRRVVKLRRICSEKIDGKSAQQSPFVWYFLDNNQKWVKYGNNDTSNSKGLVSNISSNEIEKRFQENPSQSIYFNNSRYNYELNFETMTQRNSSTNTCRDVRRRPEPCRIQKTSKKNKTEIPSHKASDLPDHWADMNSEECLKRVILSSTSEEYLNVCNLLKDSISIRHVEKVERIQNTFIWFAYQNKIRELFVKYGNEYEVNTRQLFHGTKPSVVDKICSENFDWRLHGSNVGQVYGRGTYFSPNVKTAYAYCNTDSSARYYLFVAQVAVGTYVVGNSSMVTPPTNPNTGKMYDSTVDTEFNPNIIVKYDKQEYYPEYVITINKNPFNNNNGNCIIS